MYAGLVKFTPYQAQNVEKYAANNPLTDRAGCNFVPVFDTPDDVEIRYEITTDPVSGCIRSLIPEQRQR
jgi:uncharacterized membrane protein YkgB